MPATDFGDYLSISYVDQDTSGLQKDQILTKTHTRTLPFAASPVYNAEIIDAKSLTTGEDVKTVYDLTLNIENIEHAFEPGDTVGILPSNNSYEVDQLLDRLCLSLVADIQYSLSIIPNTTKKKAAVPLHIPISSTLRELFLKHVDIRSIPKKLFLRSLIRYTTHQDEIERLQNLCCPNGTLFYADYVSKHKTLLNILQDLPSCHPPIERLLEHLPALQPRPYSISSSPLCNNTKRELHITFSVIDLDEGIKGVCTGWLETCIEQLHTYNKQTDDIEALLNNLHIVSQKKIFVPFYFRKNNVFRLPVTPSVPVVMIGPGTGVAPFLGFLEHRFLQPHEEFGTTWLFYGCRYKNRDFLFKEEIHKFQDSGTLTKLFVCFSRENNITKQYVQDLIIQNSKELVQLIRQESAVVYVCGDAKNMLKDIRNAIVSSLIHVEGLSNDDAESYIKEMELTNRYIKDVWF